MALANSYWNSTGKHQVLADKLQELIPIEGEILGSKNRQLERLRKAINCYHDLYNNGLYNRSQSFAKLFFSHTRYGQHDYVEVMYERAEEMMDQFIMQAAVEQGLVK